jgi:predicted MFS family arabinose efflux permease
MLALDTWRAVQGLGGAAMFATTLALIAQEFAGAARGRAILIWGSTVGVAVACGPLLGGLLTDYASWRWVFFVNVPIGLITVLLSVRFLGNGRDETDRRLDVPGLVAVTGALVLLVGGLLRETATDWRSTPGAVALAAGVVMLTVFAASQRRAGAMLDAQLLRNRSVSAVSLATIALGAGMFAVFLYLTIFLQGALQFSPLGGGLRLLPATAPVFLTPIVLRRAHLSPVSGRLTGIGMATIGVGLLAMQWSAADGSWLRLLPGLLIAGTGIGIANATIAATALAVVPPSRAGLAAGLSNSCRMVGISIGIAVLGAVFRAGIATQIHASTRANASPVGGHDVGGLVAAGHLSAAGGQLRGGLAQAQQAFDAGFHLLLLVAAGICLAGAVVALRWIRVGQSASAPAAKAPAALPAAAGKAVA